MQQLTEATVKGVAQGRNAVMLYSDMKVPSFVIYTNENSYDIIECKPRLFNKTRDELSRKPDDFSYRMYKDLIKLWGVLRGGNHTYKDVMDFYGSVIHTYPTIFTIKTIKDKKSLYQLLTVDHGLQQGIFVKYFGALQDDNNSASDEPGEETSDFKGLKVHFPTSMRESRKKEFLRVLEDLKNIYTKHGLSKAITGDVKFSKTDKGSLGLYYLPSNGVSGHVRIDPASKNLHKLLYVLIHEFAHKVYYELIPSKISEIQALFKEQGGREVLRKRRGGFGAIGTKIISRLEVNDVLHAPPKSKYAKLSSQWKIVSKTDRSVKIESVDDYKGMKGQKAELTAPTIDAFISAGFKPEKTEVIDVEKVGFSHMYSDLQKKVTSEFFSTGYSEVNPSEWFAETVTMYMIDALEGEIKEIIEKYLKAAK